METQAPPVTPLSTGLRYGLLLALIGILVDFLIRVANVGFLAFGLLASIGGIAVGVVGVVLAHRAFKQANEGMMSFAQGVTIAVVMLLISATASGLFNYLYLHYIDPEFVERMQQNMVDFMERNNVPDDKIEESTAKIGEMNVGLGKALLAGLTNGLTGGVVGGMIISAFTKRTRPDFE